METAWLFGLSIFVELRSTKIDKKSVVSQTHLKTRTKGSQGVSMLLKSLQTERSSVSNRRAIPDALPIIE